MTEIAGDRHGGNVVLLRTACLTLLIGLVLAWCLVLTGMRVPAFVATFKDRQDLLSSHLDFLMMTMLLLGFYASKIPLPKLVVWAMAIGSVGNPSLFLITAIAPGNRSPVMMPLTMLSISLTTAGYGLAAIKALRYSLK